MSDDTTGTGEEMAGMDDMAGADDYIRSQPWIKELKAGGHTSLQVAASKANEQGKPFNGLKFLTQM